MMTMVEIEHRLVALIQDRLNLAVPATDTDLIESGFLDSLALVTLIAALEESFACELPLDDFNLDNFRSVDRISEFLRSSGVVESRGSW